MPRVQNEMRVEDITMEVRGFIMYWVRVKVSFSD
jgi:hypothetical protein